MSWDLALEAHLGLVRKLHPPERIAVLAKECGFDITDRGNGARTKLDMDRYLSAVSAILGQVAVMSAKMKITNKARELGLLGD